MKLSDVFIMALKITQGFFKERPWVFVVVLCTSTIIVSYIYFTFKFEGYYGLFKLSEIGIVVLSVSIISYFSIIVFNKTNGFSVVDNEVQNERAKEQENKTINQIESLRFQVQQLTSRDKKNSNIAVKTQREKTMFGFAEYYLSIIIDIDQKATSAEKKSSVALDDGVKYLKMGLWFYLFSIIVWQFISHFYGFHRYYYFGIASCTIMFIFIEFAASWFLKQYRFFLETSSFYVKIKTMLDRQLLHYYLLVEAYEDEVPQSFLTSQYTALMNSLTKEICWPEMNAKHSDIIFAKEALKGIADAARIFVEKDAKEPAAPKIKKKKVE